MIDELLTPPEDAFYEVRSYYCEKVPLEQCTETAPGKQKIVIVHPKDIVMSEYFTAFKMAGKDAPKCPVHLTPMIPLLLKLPTLPKP